MRNGRNILVGKLENTRPGGTDTLQIDFMEMKWGCVDWIELAQDSDR
jgi:hypothetical protein